MKESKECYRINESSAELSHLTSPYLSSDGEVSFEESHDLFRETFPSGFPWEALSVLSGPPHVVFTWRHWGRFEGSFRGNRGNGQVSKKY